MKIILEKIQKLFEVLQFICALTAVMYGFIWFYRAFQLPYTLDNAIAECIPNIFRFLFSNPSVNFQGVVIDMSYLFASISIFLLNILIVFITGFIERGVYELEMLEIQNKDREERVLNAELEREHNTKTLEYDNFVALVDLNFQYVLEANAVSDKVDFDVLKQHCFEIFMKKLELPMGSKIGIENKKLLICVNNFDVFDRIVADCLEILKALYKANKEKKVITSFIFSTDATKSIVEIEETLKILEKITTFNYRNKIVVTTNFLSRYDYSLNDKMEAKTMGISRFFGKRSIDSRGQVQYESEDFELYSMKFKTEKTIAK